MTCSALGLGIMPLGTGPLGLYAPTEATARPSASGRFSRFINSATGDYEYDPATGQLAQMPPIRQRVLYAVGQIQETSLVLPRDGITYPVKIDGQFMSACDSAIRVALDRLVRIERVIRIEDITFELSGSRVRPTIEYTDLTTGQRDTVTR